MTFAIRIAASMLLCSLSGCVTQYPGAEEKLTFTYPLKYCDAGLLGAAQAESQKPPGLMALTNQSICVTKPVHEREERGLSEKAKLEVQAFSSEEETLRNTLETPFFLGERKRTAFGIALSGGGSKASAFAMGVLAGLSDSDLLDQADYLSSVSGGGYAAYFYYSHRLFPELRGGARPSVGNEELFRDCLSDPEWSAEDNVSSKIRSVNHCRRLELKSRSSNPKYINEDIRYQALLKCSQDLLRPGVCSMATTAGLDTGISFPGVLGLFTAAVSNLSNSLFDMGYSTSPSGRSYRDGIGLAYGATLARGTELDADQIDGIMKTCGQPGANGQDVYDCVPNFFDPDPVPLTFDELRTGLLKFRQPDKHIPFWIMNAAAPQSRSIYGWTQTGTEDITNSDMFEMTSVSHGSGRYGYVSASAAIHDMTVLDAVAASAAFLDANQLVLKNRFVRFGAGAGLHLLNLDWGYDIANYNVSTQRRANHKIRPIPFYWLDSHAAGKELEDNASQEERDRSRSVFIRLIDGGNAENLGVYSLLKRGMKNILVSDAAADEDGLFKDVCGLSRRLSNTPAGIVPRNVHIPGLGDLSKHCGAVDQKKFGYNMHGWLVEDPVLFGCIRYEDHGESEKSCANLQENEVRLFIAKPAINFAEFSQTQMKSGVEGKLSDCYARGVDTLARKSLINCDSAIYLKFNQNVEKGVTAGCPIFPQHSTVLVTANSSSTIFVAYRELARQYVALASRTIQKILKQDPAGIAEYDNVLKQQFKSRIWPTGSQCGDKV
jgi:hypothetical protein